MDNKFKTELLECLTKVELDVIRKALVEEIGGSLLEALKESSND